MKIALLAVFCSVGVATSAPAQTPAVRLQVWVDSWLDTTPIDVRAEVSARLHNAGIEVTEDPSAPIVTIDYVEEAAAPPYYPRLVPSTRIKIGIEIRDAGGSRGLSSFGFNVWPNFPPPPRDHFPSAVELRSTAIEALRLHRSFLTLGHLVGAYLGLEASLRELMTMQETEMIAEMLLFDRLAWSPTTDDLFERAIRGMETRRGLLAAATLERFLEKQTDSVRSPDSPIGAFLAVLEALGERGGSSSVDVVKRFVSTEKNPLIIAAAQAAVDRIAERQTK
jgi:hypothetical protein